MASVAWRTIQSAAIVFLVASATFVLLKLAPGDPFGDRSERNVPQSVIEQHRRNFGLDQPVHVQYLRYVTNLASGDLGYSFSMNQPVAGLLIAALPNTLLLAVAALAIDFALGITLGTVQGARAGSRLDDSLTVVTLILFSVPVFWLGVMLILVFAETLGWLPAGSTRSAALYPSLPFIGKVADRLHHLILPAVTLGLVSAAVTARYHRGAMLEAVTQDFIRTARAKGLSERTVLLGHALRNALLPAVTLFGLSLPVLLSGSVLVENVFAWNGMGRVAVEAIFRRDYQVVTGAAILASTMVVIGNLFADLLYRVVDPRTRRAS